MGREGFKCLGAVEGGYEYNQNLLYEIFKKWMKQMCEAKQQQNSKWFMEHCNALLNIVILKINFQQYSCILKENLVSEDLDCIINWMLSFNPHLATSPNYDIAVIVTWLQEESGYVYKFKTNSHEALFIHKYISHFFFTFL